MSSTIMPITKVTSALLICWAGLACAPAKAETVRIATFNCSLNRAEAGQLVADLATGNDPQAAQIAEVIQRVRPHILLLNEVDFDEQRDSIRLLHDRYLRLPQRNQSAIEYPFTFAQPVNTGLPSGVDLNRDGKITSPQDAFGFGRFPGQYGMAVLSRFPIQASAARTMQKLLWNQMPQALLPTSSSSMPYYSREALAVFRLSSKSHWDVPIKIGNRTLHFLVAHPTPPVFDGDEDRNGRRNHDEIRLWADYISPDRSNYIYDDRGHRGGLAPGASFVIAGDYNADPHDGDSTNQAINLLLSHPRVNSSIIPSSAGAAAQTDPSDINHRHQGNPAHDTSNFGRSTGNLRVDYVLPSKDLKILSAGVFWPAADADGSDLLEASDHRLVWIDVQIP